MGASTQLPGSCPQPPATAPPPAGAASLAARLTRWQPLPQLSLARHTPITRWGGPRPRRGGQLVPTWPPRPRQRGPCPAISGGRPPSAPSFHLQAPQPIPRQAPAPSPPPADRPAQPALAPCNHALHRLPPAPGGRPLRVSCRAGWQGVGPPLLPPSRAAVLAPLRLCPFAVRPPLRPAPQPAAASPLMHCMQQLPAALPQLLPRLSTAAAGAPVLQARRRPRVCVPAQVRPAALPPAVRQLAV